MLRLPLTSRCRCPAAVGRSGGVQQSCQRGARSGRPRGRGAGRPARLVQRDPGRGDVTRGRSAQDGGGGLAEAAGGRGMGGAGS